MKGIQKAGKKGLDCVRVGLVGAGGMGTVHVQNLLKVPGSMIAAVCDGVEENAAKASDLITEAGYPAPHLYTRGERDFERMCGEEDLDIVYAATPWEWHTPVCVAAMEQGKHAATEVPAAVSLQECWQLVETSEKTGKHCSILENCCYDQVELMILNMVRQGLLGHLIYAECGYLHDLREYKFRHEGAARWRTNHSIRRNEDLYPTHGLGPVAQCMNITRGNRFTHLVSMSTSSNGLRLYAEKTFGEESPQAKREYALGDVVTTLIQTVKGQTILVKHDTDSPRPYSRGICVQGTKGIVRKYPEEKIYIEDRTEGHEWEPLSNYREEFEHPLFRDQGDKSTDVGHGSMDYIVDARTIGAVREGRAPDIDVYDTASWSAVSALSGQSIAAGNRPVEVPDFTRGRWEHREPLGIVS